MIIGMDFGTTNTGAAYFDGDQVHLIKLDPDHSIPQVCRSAIYMTRSGEYYLGSSATKMYFKQNIGRPTRFRKVRVGEIMQVFAELPVYYRDVFIFEDEFSPGRLFTSVKTALRSRENFGTAFRGYWYSASDLVAIFLTGMRLQMEAQLEQPVERVVLGRPVHFSAHPEEDQIAQSRLLDAAFKAGFEEVALEYEPVAAALAYSSGLKERQRVLVFDFGGGTLDFTIMEVGGDHEQVVLATGGVPIAGDIFDQRLFRATIPPFLGEGGEYISGGSRRPIPAHIFDTLSHPYEILTLNTPQNLEILRSIHAGALEPEKTYILQKVISANYALMIFDLVEQAKQRLSMDYLTKLVIETPDFIIRDRITRMGFEQAIAQEVKIVHQELLATLQKADLRPEQIDRVIRTGGSSQIPAFINLLSEIFGHDKVQAIDIFSSVTSGLAIRAYQLENKLVEKNIYTPDTSLRSQELSVEQPERTGEQGIPSIKAVDLQGIASYLRVHQQTRRDPHTLPGMVLFLLSDQGLLAIPSDNHGPELLTEAMIGESGLKPGVQAAVVELEDRLMLITNQLKLFSPAVRDLYLAQLASENRMIESLPLDREEKVTAMISFSTERLQNRLIGMITNTGQGRVFDAVLLSEAISRRVFYQLERRYQGIPQLFFTGSLDELVLVGTDQGRIAQITMRELMIQAGQVVRLKSAERVSAVLSTSPGTDVWAISSEGKGIKLESIKPFPREAPVKRTILIKRNFSIVGLLIHEHLVKDVAWGITNTGYLVRLEIPRHGETVVKLDKQQYLVGCYSLD